LWTAVAFGRHSRSEFADGGMKRTARPIQPELTAFRQKKAH
jgi:hypothetical protein